MSWDLDDGYRWTAGRERSWLLTITTTSALREGVKVEGEHWLVSFWELSDAFEGLLVVLIVMIAKLEWMDKRCGGREMYTGNGRR